MEKSEQSAFKEGKNLLTDAGAKYRSVAEQNHQLGFKEQFGREVEFHA